MIDQMTWEEVQAHYHTDEPAPDEILIAVYQTGDYEGSSVVAYRNGDKYYYVYGGHCSCYGLEGQFEPEEYESKELFIAALKIMIPYTGQEEHQELLEKLTK